MFGLTTESSAIARIERCADSWRDIVAGRDERAKELREARNECVLELMGVRRDLARAQEEAAAATAEAERLRATPPKFVRMGHSAVLTGEVTGWNVFGEGETAITTVYTTTSDRVISGDHSEALYLAVMRAG